VVQPVLQSEQYPRRYSVCTGIHSIFPLFLPYRPKLDEAKQTYPSSQASPNKSSNGPVLRATRRYRPGLSRGTTRFAIGAIPKQLQRVYCHTLDFPPISPYIPPIAPAEPVYTVYTQKWHRYFLNLYARVFNRFPSKFGNPKPTHFPACIRSLRTICEKSGRRGRGRGDAR